MSVSHGSLVSEKADLLKMRNFIVPLNRKFSTGIRIPEVISKAVHGRLRVLQFNILADGLSGLREDKGAFSRVKYQDIIWENRKVGLLKEMTQYDPDVITLQECDHYYDYFLPNLQNKGYSGAFVPKPNSTCLEAGGQSDGCAIFVKSDRLRIVNTETLNYAMSKSQITGTDGDSPEFAKDTNTHDGDDTPVPQNQVALILTCELRCDGQTGEEEYVSVPVVIATTHLKAEKSAVGERYRKIQLEQLLQAVQSTCDTVARNNSADCVHPAVIITGDFNACPPSQSSVCGYDSTAYKVLQKAPPPLCLRSVYNDDLVETLGLSDDSTIWTTWKARDKKKRNKSKNNTILCANDNNNGGKDTSPVTTTTASTAAAAEECGSYTATTAKDRDSMSEESITRMCIDYILYNSGPNNPENAVTAGGMDTAGMSVVADSGCLSGKIPSPPASTERKLYIQALSALELFSDEYIVEGNYIPSAIYPSDHIAIVADLQIVE